MLNFFEPQLKVQKNRHVIRLTDTRMAKYSRRGIISNFLIFILCLVFEPTFYQKHPGLTMTLSSGLFILTVLRGYLLFRFEAIYPRAPTAWRQKYFLVTLLGACWWALILGSFTLTLDLAGMSPLLWLYTVVFFAITANAFAPYQKFLSIYQFIGIVPAATCTFFIGELTGVFYGLILLMFYWTLKHHCDITARSYWDQQEASYTLSHRAETLEEEKRDSRASMSLTRDFVNLLDDKLQVLFEDDSDEGMAPVKTTPGGRQRIEHLRQRVGAFRRVLNKESSSHAVVFNAAHYLHFLVARQVDDAERSGIELEIALSPALPVHLHGEVARLGEIISLTLKSVIEQSGECLLFVEAEYLRGSGDAGELQIALSRQQQSARKGFFNDPSARTVYSDLDLLVARGLAESLNGSLELQTQQMREGKCVRLHIPLNMAASSPERDYSRPLYKGHNLLLIHPQARWLDNKRLEMSILGFDVETTMDFRKAIKILAGALSSGKMIESVMYNALPGDEAAVQFCNDLLDHPDLKYTHHFVIASAAAQTYFRSRMVRDSPIVHFIDRPSGLFELEIALTPLFDTVSPGTASKTGLAAVLWIAVGKAVNGPTTSESQTLSITRVADLKMLEKYLQEQSFALYVVEHTDVEELDFIQIIRRHIASQSPSAVRPIVGVGPGDAQLRMLEAGADHFIKIDKLATGDTRELRYWVSGRV